MSTTEWEDRRFKPMECLLDQVRCPAGGTRQLTRDDGGGKMKRRERKVWEKSIMNADMGNHFSGSAIVLLVAHKKIEQKRHLLSIYAQLYITSLLIIISIIHTSQPRPPCINSSLPHVSLRIIQNKPQRAQDLIPDGQERRESNSRP
jgi:hypothetical protein